MKSSDVPPERSVPTDEDVTPDIAEMALPRCRLSFSQCFTVDKTVGDGSKASEVFKQLAFREPRCGDCGAAPSFPPKADR